MLRCGGVPNTAFSRLEFSPRSCLFTDTTVNTTSVPSPFLARNTGTLPLSINAAGVEQTPVNGPLSMISTTCTAGRVLALNDSCEMSTRFNAPNVVSTSRGLAKVIYSAADQIEFQVLAMELEARSIAAPPSDGESLFKNGFELTAAQCLTD